METIEELFKNANEELRKLQSTLRKLENKIKNEKDEKKTSEQVEATLPPINEILKGNHDWGAIPSKDDEKTEKVETPTEESALDGLPEVPEELNYEEHNLVMPDGMPAPVVEEETEEVVEAEHKDGIKVTGYKSLESNTVEKVKGYFSSEELNKIINGYEVTPDEQVVNEKESEELEKPADEAVNSVDTSVSKNENINYVNDSILNNGGTMGSDGQIYRPASEYGAPVSVKDSVLNTVNVPEEAPAVEPKLPTLENPTEAAEEIVHEEEKPLEPSEVAENLANNFGDRRMLSIEEMLKTMEQEEGKGK